MSNKLSDIVDFNPLRTLKRGTTAPFIEMASLPTNTKFIEQIDTKVFSGGSKFKNGDTLFARITPCLENGKTGKVTGLDEGSIGHGSTEFIVMSAKDPDFDEDYIYYFARLPEFREFAQQRMVGTSGRQRVAWQDLAEFAFTFPSKEERKRAAELLNVFDKKIQLNTQINQTLEQIAQGIFKSWFVDFDPVRAKADSLAQGKTQAEAELAAQQIISGKTPEELTALSQTHPDQYAELAEIAKAFPSEFEEVEGFGEVPRGWEITTLSEICEMQNGYAFKSSDWTENGIPIIKIGSIKPIIIEVEGNGFVSNEYQNLRPDFLLTSGDILVGLTGYVGEVGRIPQGKVAMLNQRVAKFLPKEIDKNHNFYNYIYCLARQKQFKEFAEMNAKGSAQANISTKELLKFPIIKADNECHILFENKIKAILEKILANSQNSEELASVRDLLLPRLLSGEIHL